MRNISQDIPRSKLTGAIVFIDKREQTNMICKAQHLFQNFTKTIFNFFKKNTTEKLCMHVCMCVHACNFIKSKTEKKNCLSVFTCMSIRLWCYGFWKYVHHILAPGADFVVTRAESAPLPFWWWVRGSSCKGRCILLDFHDQAGRGWRNI